MADWKQITARIRRARTGKDPAAQLSNLYQKTRDAMVAFELAKFFETDGQNGEAAKWYSTAAERFRRADWKTKAQEAAVRLGGSGSSAETAAQADELQVSTPMLSVPEPALPFEQTAETFEAIVAPAAEPSEGTIAEAPRRGTRRRGRRGGRNRRKASTTAEQPARSPVVPAETPVEQAPPPVDEAPEPRFSRVSESVSPRRPSSEPVSDSAASLRGRYGDPGLSSRLSLLEMQFRRLLTCAPLTISEADRAPVGPGVLLLSDSDLSTYYYVEPCQTLRIAIGSFLRGTASRRGSDSIKPRLAEHLGIAETRVAKYLADHCVVRYLQLDDGASHFAHFVTAVLRPALND
ncbi:MAG: hypothetical protein JWO71_2219 [Candidatus Acidoferrum typicum]|nr:hypothetical protein [Candidatus Acidoferrum typicum]